MGPHRGALCGWLLAGAVACGGPRVPTDAQMTGAAPPSVPVARAEIAPPSDAGTAPQKAGAFAELTRMLQPDTSSTWDMRRVWLLSYVEEDGVMRIECRARGGAESSELMRRMAASSTFENVVLERARRSEREDDLDVTIRARVPTRNENLALTRAQDAAPYLAGASRNPFESPFTSGAPPMAHGVADEHEIDQLRVVGIVHGPKSSAVLADASGKGWVALTGDFVGRASEPRAAPSPACRWRVARIAEDSVWLMRAQAPRCPTAPSERVLRVR